MKVLIDLNVLLDVVQKREPFYASSAAVLDRVATGALRGVIPSHAVTTLYYIVHRYSGAEPAYSVIDWLLEAFEIAPETALEYRRARQLQFSDFEDAVTACTAAALECQLIVTRNARDFTASPVPAVDPTTLLTRLSEENSLVAP